MARRLLLIAAACLVIAACSGPLPDAPSDSLRRGLSAQPESLDPQQARSVAALAVAGELFEGLLTRDARGALVAGVAERWQLSGDEREYRFTLRRDARWADGEPVTAADFVRAWRYLTTPDSAAFYADLLRPVEHADAVLSGARLPHELGVQQIDDRTLLVRLVAPHADFLERVAHPALAPRREDPVIGVGNGAYRLIASDNGGRLTLRANPYFHAADSVAISEVIYQAYDQELTEYNEFRSGGLDITDRVPRQVFRDPDDMPPGLRVAPYLGVVYLSFNMREPPPLGLRQALSMAIDRRALAARVLGRGELPAWGLVPPGAANGVDDYQPYANPLQTMPDSERIALAQSLYARVSDAQDVPPRITLNYASSDENRVVAAALQSMWREVLPGIEVLLENREFRVLLAMGRRGEFDGLLRGSWIADFNDAGQFVGLLASDSPANTPGYTDARYDLLLQAAAVTADPAQRAMTLRAIESEIALNVPVIPLHYFVSKHLLHPRVAGWQDNPLDLHYSRYLRLTDAQPREPD